jgi:hypothetical protein
MGQIGLYFLINFPNFLGSGFHNRRFGHVILAVRNQFVPVRKRNDRHPINLASLVTEAVNPMSPLNEVTQPPLDVNIGSVSYIAKG